MKTEKSFSFRSALVALFMLVSATVMAQTTVTGSVRDDAGEPIIGATVREVGTQNATVTDFNGNYSVKVSDANATLSISYVGFQTQEVKLAGRKTVSLSLKADDELLDEVVVVGYGVQKKKLVTGATVQVKGDDITKLNTTQALGALQSQTPGVNIQSVSGQPGDGFKVSIRGAGSNMNSTPLYVIDGVAGGDINSINPADIESIDVLKDAASCAIYGSAAANGVILVTTKSGKAGGVQVSYDGNIGWQNMYRLPQMLTAKQYMQIQDLAQFNSGLSPWNWESYFQDTPESKTFYSDLYKSYMDGSNPGTNWIDEIRNKNAITTSHALNISGGNDYSTYSVGAGYQYQDGIVGGPVKSDFSRFTFRLNSEHVLYRGNKNYDVIKVGENVYYRHTQKQGIDNGDQYSNLLSDAIRMTPIVPVYNYKGEYFALQDFQETGLFGYNSYLSNPVYQAMNSQSGNNENRSYGLNAVGYIEIQPLKGLVYRGQVSYNQSSWSWRNFLPEYYINNQGAFNSEAKATNQMGLGWGWNTTNTLNYRFDVKKHNFDILVGTEYGQSRPTYGMSLYATSSDPIVADLAHAYMSMMKNNTSASVSGLGYTDSKSMSYFGRLNYNYNETYLLSAIMRADGTSLFAPGHRWGYFPSVSAGWVVSNEPFMQSISDVMDFLKIRAGWGQNGNKVTNAFAYEAAFAYDAYSNYSFGNTKDDPIRGASLSRLGDEDLTWETSEQLNVGIDARFLNGRLNVNADWYKKTTRDLLFAVPVPATTGFSSQMKNAGTVQNTGIEANITWNDKIGSEFNYHVGYNFAWNKNKVTKVNSSIKYIENDANKLSQGTGITSRCEEGFPIGYFYGLKTVGVIQNYSQLQDYLNANCGGNPANSIQGTDLKVGDLMFVDTNGDGVVNDDDRTMIGDPNPDFTMGLNLGFDYKGFDFNLTAYAALGQQVARSYRRFYDSGQDNFTTEVFDYWMGEGTSNKFPQLNVMNTGANWGPRISDVWIENASYARIQNITIGYDFARLLKNSPFQQLRVYAAAQNLWTFTGYKGMDPENGKSICSQSWATGIDVGNYPQPRTYMVGVNVKFADKSKKKSAPVYVQAEPQYIEKIVEKVVEKPVTKVEKETELVQNTHVVTFEVNSYQIANIAELAGIAKGANVEVVAYASPEGNADANMALSQKRADAVADYLKSKGVNVTRVEAKGADSKHANRIAIVTVK